MDKSKTYKEYLKSFIIGSSWLVFIWFFISVARINKNYTYENYSMISPVYLGLMNVFSLYLSKIYNLTLRQRYILIGLISPLIVFTFAYLSESYNYDNREWVYYLVYIIIKHFLIFNLIIYNLELYLTPEHYDSINESNEIKNFVNIIFKRGILAPDCHYWNISNEKLEDSMGNKMFYKLKNKYGDLYKVDMLDETIYIVTDVNTIKIILDNSPMIFGVGKLKYNIFKSFMPKNVGVSEGCPWISRRTLNINALDTDRIHRYARSFHESIGGILQKFLPKNFKEFGIMGKKISGKIVFNRDDVPVEVFQIFGEANSPVFLETKNVVIDPEIIDVYSSYLNSNIENSSENSLIYISKQFKYDKGELFEQIPHWIFPIVGLITVAVPRFLTIIGNHPSKLEKLLNGLKDINLNPKNIYNYRYFRNCILEVFRLNNPVVTTFRTLLEDYKFPGKDKTFKKGEQLLILNNSIMRDGDFFQNPNQFIPDRWSMELENSYYAIMFNQGPQRCPGKELAIFLLQSFLTHYFIVSGMLDRRRKMKVGKIDTGNIPGAINPCNVEIGFE